MRLPFAALSGAWTVTAGTLFAAGAAANWLIVVYVAGVLYLTKEGSRHA